MNLNETSFLFALLRFIFIGLFFYCIQKYKSKDKDFLLSEFLISNGSKYAAISICIIFILIQCRAYNLFNYLVLLTVFGIFEVNNFNNPKIIWNRYIRVLDQFILDIIEFLESSNKVKLLHEKIDLQKISKNEFYDILSVFCIIFFAVFSKLHFYSNDLFLFSESWFYDLDKIIEIQKQNWLGPDYSEMGQYALISIFSMLFKVSAAMSLQTFGILQNILLSILIFWVVKKISNKSTLLIPLISAILFLESYIITPVDMTFVFKHQKVFTAIFIIIPTVITFTRKQHFYQFKKSIVIHIITLFSIAFLHFSTLFILVLPSYLFLLFYDNSKPFLQKIKLLFAFGCIVSLVILLLQISYAYGDFDTAYFIKNSFIEVSNFTQIQSTDTSYQKIILAISMIACTILIWNSIHRNTDTISVILCSLFLFVSAIHQTNHYLVDTHLTKSILIILTPILLGIIVTEFLFYSLQHIPMKYIKYLTFIIFCSTGYTISKKKSTVKTPERSNETNRQILATYDKIITNHLPFSFAVVNHQKAYSFSELNHFFINYKELNQFYATKDSIFHTHKKDKKFLKNNPNSILPNSVFLFEILGVDQNISRIGFLTEKDQLIQNDSLITILKRRNRKVLLYRKTDRIRVYKIINKENSSDFNKLLFYDKRS